MGLCRRSRATGRPRHQGMSFELDSFHGRPCDSPGCALSTNPSLSCARTPPTTRHNHQRRRQSMQGRSIGLDVHRDFCEVAICESDGRVRRAPRVAARRGALREFAEQLGPQDRVAMEATGNALLIARIIRPHVADVIVANTRRLAAIAEAKNKTDRRDARTIAQLLHAGLLEDCWQPDETIRALRRRTTRRAKLVRHPARFKNEILAVLPPHPK